MRIFYASDTTPNGSINSNLWKNNLYDSLIDLENEIIEFKYDLKKTFQNTNYKNSLHKKFIDKNRPKLSNELLKQIRKAHLKKPIDIFFSYFYDAFIFPETIDQIKALGIKTVNWYCNGSYQLDLVSKISPHYDYCLVPEKFRLQDYKNLGANPIYCQEAANHNIYKPHNIQQKFNVTFVGQAYGDRPEYIKYLLDNKIDIKVWGPQWDQFAQKKHTYFYKTLRKIKSKILHKKIFPITNILPNKIVGAPLSDFNMIKMYSQSKINLGFSSCGETHKNRKKILQIRLRDFEVPMSGGFYMVEYMEELKEFFEIGKEIVCYKNKDDLIDKIKYYLKHESEREKIRLAGYQRCLKDHTWQKRFTSVFKQMNL